MTYWGNRRIRRELRRLGHTLNVKSISMAVVSPKLLHLVFSRNDRLDTWEKKRND